MNRSRCNTCRNFVTVRSWLMHNKKILHGLAQHFAAPVENEVAEV